MRIAIISPYFLPYQTGGVEYTVKNLARELSKLGHEVAIFTSTDNGRQKHIGVPKTVVQDAVSVNFIETNFGTINPDLSQYDVIHIQNYNRLLTDRLIAKWSNKPIIITLHGSLIGPLYENFSILRTAKLFHDKTLAKILLKRAKRVVALSQFEQRFLIQKMNISANLVSIIPNGLPQDAFSRDSFGSLPVDNNQRYICTVARIAKRKSLDHVLMILPDLPDDIHYLIAGPDEGEVPRLIGLATRLGVKNRVHFLGPISDTTKYVLMKNASAFVLPSRFEMQPISLLESMAQGTPVVSTNAGGTSDIIENGRNGLLYRWGDLRELAKSVSLLLEDSPYRRMIIREGFACASRFTWERVARLTDLLYTQVCATSSN